jgi:hypothetical protein
MKESEAWREVARRIAEGEWQARGLCREVEIISCASYTLWANMSHRQAEDDEKQLATRRGR